MPEFFIHHRTKYVYPEKVVDSANQIKLYPLHDSHQRPIDHRLVISNQPMVFTLQDYFGNTTGFFSIVLPHQELSIESFLHVEMTKPFFAPRESPHEVWGKYKDDPHQLLYYDFLKAEAAQAEQEVQDVIRQFVNSDEHPLDSIHRLAGYVYQNFAYKKGVTNVETGVDEIWRLKAGVCQDFAHLLLYMLRLLGIPCRYISGYICPGHSEWRGEGATHAWVEAWMHDMGWVGIDPTNNCLAGERHVRLATGRNFSDVTPVKGTYKGSENHLLEVTVQFSHSEFTDRQLHGVAPTYVNDLQPDPLARNSYAAYMQMQQQQ